MDLIFTKGAGKSDRLQIIRNGVQEAEITCPKQRIIPHDMMHHAVESVLAARGFLGRVARGEEASFQMQSEAESDGVERLVEVMQGEAWSVPTETSALIDLYRVTCEARQCPMLPVDDSVIDAIRARIADLTLTWDATPVGGTMMLRFDG